MSSAMAICMCVVIASCVCVDFAHVFNVYIYTHGMNVCMRICKIEVSGVDYFTVKVSQF